MFENFNYDPKKGNFERFNLHSKQWKFIKKTPDRGCRYLRARYFYKTYFLHTIAFYKMTGRLPLKGKHIDHINGDRLDNRWENLREVDPIDNQSNRTYHREAKEPGVSFIKSSGRWRAQITFRGKSFFLGEYDSKSRAMRVRGDAFALRFDPIFKKAKSKEELFSARASNLQWNLTIAR